MAAKDGGVPLAQPLGRVLEIRFLIKSAVLPGGVIPLRIVHHIARAGYSTSITAQRGDSAGQSAQNRFPTVRERSTTTGNPH